jgi:diguanylate cyclase (GGDEF)-like protein
MSKLVRRATLSRLALIVALAVTFAAWQVSREAELRRTSDALRAHLDNITAALYRGVQAQEPILHGVAAVVKTAPRGLDANWREYVQSLRLADTAPPIKQLGYAALTSADVELLRSGKPLDARAASVSRAGASYTPRADWPTALFSEPLVREALARVLTSSSANQPSAVWLESEKKGSMVVVLPVFPNAAAAQRPTPLRGFVFASVDPRLLFQDILAQRGLAPDIELDIVDGADEDHSVTVFTSVERLVSARASRAVVELSRRIEIGGRPWHLRAATAPGYDPRTTSTLVLVAGLALSALVFSVLQAWTMLARRTGAIASRLSEDLQQSEDRLRHLAHHDALTGLPNRVLLQEHVTNVLARARRYETKAAVLFIDLDRFKHINDTLGHYTGDQVLKLAARRIETGIREEDFVARMGGDEFAVIIGDLKDPQDASLVANNILRILAKPCTFAGQELLVTPSVGISVFPQDGEDLETLLKNADAAMYLAKENGRNNSQFFTRDINRSVRERIALEAALHHALERDELVIHYQPQVELWSGKLVGVEALLRWRHPERGLIPPADFIPIAEDTGFIIPMGEWALREACGQLAAWRAQGVGDLRLAVNFSARQLSARNLPSALNGIFAQTGLRPSDLELELTETGLLQNTDAAAAGLKELKDLGVELSMDDFGTGYSSLSYLRAFPIDKVKIDRSFVRDITIDPNDAALVRALIELAHSLNLRIVAEGVEIAEQLEFLRRHRCDEAQGYYFAKPLPAQECLQFLLSWRKPETWPALTPILSAVS